VVLCPDRLRPKDPEAKQSGYENERSFPSRGEVKCRGAVPPWPLDDSML
jgi:hypothetical protein